MLSLLVLLVCSVPALATGLLQEQFDHLGPQVKTLESPVSGRTISFVDEGAADWHPVLFLGGGGTSVRVMALTNHLRTTRENLRLRFISVQRNGFGETPFDDSLGYADYLQDVEDVLAHLGIGRYSLFAISGGGPYAAAIANAHHDRLRSLHLASALTWFAPDALECLVPPEALTVFTRDPRAWFGFATDSPVQGIPGFQDSAYDDAARTFNLGGQSGDPAALHHELRLYCDNPTLPDLTAVTAPAFLYYGDADTTTPPDTHLPRWREALPNAAITVRLDPGAGHDAQYRHLDQILVDLAGLQKRIVVCNGKGRTLLVRAHRADRILDSGGFLGICAWGE
ncbi:MAG: alpha/beta hydrolase [Halioglobus sp.]|nr:alpha/beta hydrolase [Halioglobus sp.]